MTSQIFITAQEIAQRVIASPGKMIQNLIDEAKFHFKDGCAKWMENHLPIENLTITRDEAKLFFKLFGIDVSGFDAGALSVNLRTTKHSLVVRADINSTPVAAAFRRNGENGSMGLITFGVHESQLIRSLLPPKLRGVSQEHRSGHIEIPHILGAAEKIEIAKEIREKAPPILELAGEKIPVRTRSNRGPKLAGKQWE